jgi:hypothetical protein
MTRITFGILLIVVLMLSQSKARATTYNCFEVDKRASLGIDGGVVNVNGDQSQKTCKFSVNNATVDSIGAGGSGLNALLQQPKALPGLKDGGLENFRTAMLSPFADTTNDALAQEFDAVFAAYASKVANCLAEFVEGAEQQLGLNSIICQSVQSRQNFEFRGLHGTASQLILIIGVSLDKSAHVLILSIPQGLARAAATGQFRFP